MPFICGVLPSYLPDLSLLEGVVFVDLDANTVKYHSSDPVPKFQRISNERGIVKLVSNPKKPVAANVEMDDVVIRSAFINFFGKMLKDYKICKCIHSAPFYLQCNVSVYARCRCDVYQA